MAPIKLGVLVGSYQTRSPSWFFQTKFSNVLSDTCPISASVIQGSALGPAAFLINASDLYPLTPGNVMYKYADDVFLLVPSPNTPSIPGEIEHLSSWALNNNLRLNASKTHELLLAPRGLRSRALVLPPPCPGVARSSSLKILGVTLQDNLTMGEHVSNLVAKGSQSLFALKVLKRHGLADAALHTVGRAILVSRLTYAMPAWAGFSSVAEMNRLQAVLSKAKRWGLSGGTPYPGIAELSSMADQTLFKSSTSNPYRVLHRLLPPPVSHSHHLRSRPHNFTLPKSSTSRVRNFLHRMLYKDMY